MDCFNFEDTLCDLYIQLWHVFASECPPECHRFFLFQVKSLVFDQSGTYLAVGGSDIRVYICKQWSEVLNFTGDGDIQGQTILSCSSCLQVTLFWVF